MQQGLLCSRGCFVAGAALQQGLQCMMTCSTVLARWLLQAVELCLTMLQEHVPKLAWSALLCKHACIRRVMACCAYHVRRTALVSTQQASAVSGMLPFMLPTVMLFGEVGIQEPASS